MLWLLVVVLLLKNSQKLMHRFFGLPLAALFWGVVFWARAYNTTMLTLLIIKRWTCMRAGTTAAAATCDATAATASPTTGRRVQLRSKDICPTLRGHDRARRTGPRAAAVARRSWRKRVPNHVVRMIPETLHLHTSPRYELSEELFREPDAVHCN